MRSRFAPLLAALLLLLPTLAVAAERPLVIFFGGYGATEADMQLWQNAAAAHPRYGRRFEFEAIAYPRDVSSSVSQAVAAAAGTIDAVIAQIHAMPGRRIIVVGHSSGAGLAVSVVTRTPDNARIKLISLDAGINTEAPPPPDVETYPIRSLDCWSVASSETLSFGYRRAKKLCKNRFFVMRSETCQTAVCLHFRVVNRRADPNLTFLQSRELADGVSRGYADLDINLDWLDNVP